MEHEKQHSIERLNSIHLIKDWLQHETPFTGRTDELFISNFLEVCSYDVEKTKQRISTYYELRNLYPRLMTNRDILEEKKMKIYNQCMLSSDTFQEDYKLPVVIVVKASRLDSNDAMYNAMQLSIICAEVALLHSARCRKYGAVCIFDMEDMQFCHMLQITPNFLMESFRCVLEGLPLNICEIHYINTGYVLKAALTVASLVLPVEKRKIVHISSGSWDSIEVPPQCLPIEYGGTNGNLKDNNEIIKSMLMKWRDHLLDDEKYGFNE